MEVFWPVEPTTIPELAVARDDLEWFELPPLCRKLLEHVDGTATRRGHLRASPASR